MIVFVHDLDVIAKHGVYEEERRDGRRFIFDLEVDVPDPGDADVLGDTIDYRSLASIVMKHVKGESVQLIETLGERILDDVLADHPTVDRAEIRIRKKATGVPGNPGFVGIRLTRER